MLMVYAPTTVVSQRSPRTETFEYRGVEDGQLFHTRGATLEAVYTPGHTDDHVAFILREEQVIFTT